MATITRVETIAITGTDVRVVADDTWQEITGIYNFYAKTFPYDMKKLKLDIAQIYLWDMADRIVVQFYDHEMKERLSYEFVPLADPGAVHTPPGEFPRFEISPDWKVRVVAVRTTRKPESEVAEFYKELGWRTCESLIRTGEGTTEKYASFRSGGFSVSREVYKDFEEKPAPPAEVEI